MLQVVAGVPAVAVNCTQPSPASGHCGPPCQRPIEMGQRLKVTRPSAASLRRSRTTTPVSPPRSGGSVAAARNRRALIAPGGLPPVAPW